VSARELASDADRIFPGEGDFYLDPIIDHLRRIGYGGYLSLELIKPRTVEGQTLFADEARRRRHEAIARLAGDDARLSRQSGGWSVF
jgi:sugar phosphate isomerase/epimerase